MDIHLLSVPYDTARRGERMGAGPEHLLSFGAVERLRSRGHRVHVEDVSPLESDFPAEIRTAFELQRAVAAAVGRAVADGALPVVLAGNCNTAALGTLAGLRARNVGVIWFDSHADFNTPETTIGGFLDGMALAMITGGCWRQLIAQLPDFEPVEPANVLLLGARDLDPLEALLLAESPVTLLRPAQVGTGLAPVLDRFRQRLRSVYVHIDLDVLDPVAHGHANALAAPNGLTVDQVASALELIAQRFRIVGAALTAYDPSCDADGSVCRAALTLLEVLANVAETANSRSLRHSAPSHTTEDA